MELKPTNLFSSDEHTNVVEPPEHNIDVVKVNNLTIQTWTAYYTDLKLLNISVLEVIKGVGV